MPTIIDKEFGTITVRRSVKATQVKIRVSPNGTLRASLPMYAPLFLLKRLIQSSRTELREMIDRSTPHTAYMEGQQIGKSHTLITRPGSEVTVKRNSTRIEVTLPSHTDLHAPEVIDAIRPVAISALRIEAKSYLPKRLSYLAAQYGYSYDSVRFSHAGSRWGSCSSSGTISLNIALMKLPFELIDYVLLHELAHTKEMNHSDRFWKLVGHTDPSFKLHRRLLKQEQPHI